MQRVDVTYSLITDLSRTKVLMVKNVGDAGDFRWSLPGGAVEADETLEQAAVREAKEETGLDVRVYGVVAINECKYTKSQNHAIFYTFRAEIIGGEETLQRPDEIAEIAWIAIEQADELMPYYPGGLHRLIAGHEIPYVDEGIK
ncbi:NUDIX hydrolase [Paenibacillus sacheonensis]|uniref:NUDIX domain-containing protein n=1 Tax=Paenibacillus sacheonensis TaxID=742054 RepID=A0A7X4YQ47_9BACL|nr:NUDIX hydrolase [Paenibacillus sacheonensis]NBC69534.1 NUDIX domain-containing protein [Paenibacillus sacheonensis]